MAGGGHLAALHQRLAHECARLAAAKSDGERQTRETWIAGIEKEIAAEYRFLGIETADEDMSDDELLAALLA
jgi:hypothetical protein